jgi:hypothetical protein
MFPYIYCLKLEDIQYAVKLIVEENTLHVGRGDSAG